MSQVRRRIADAERIYVEADGLCAMSEVPYPQGVAPHRARQNRSRDPVLLERSEGFTGRQAVSLQLLPDSVLRSAPYDEDGGNQERLLTRPDCGQHRENRAVDNHHGAGLRPGFVTKFRRECAPNNGLTQNTAKVAPIDNSWRELSCFLRLSVFAPGCSGVMQWAETIDSGRSATVGRRLCSILAG
jgi:hypothetical protein